MQPPEFPVVVIGLGNSLRSDDGVGLTVAATHMGWPMFLNDLDRVIEIHKMWKCEHPAIGGLPGDYRGVDGVKRFIDELTPIAWPTYA